MLITDSYKQLRQELQSLIDEETRVNQEICHHLDVFKVRVTDDIFAPTPIDCIQESVNRLQYITDLHSFKAQLVERMLVCIVKLKELDNMIEYSEMLEDCLSLEVQ